MERIKLMKEKLTEAQTALIVMLVIFVFLLSVKMFLMLYKKTNKQMQNCTKDMVEKTVRKMVKPEYLIGE